MFVLESMQAEDYYTDEKGRVVFTEAYHKKRGYCCGNNCKHCPYKTNDSTKQTVKHGR